MRPLSTASLALLLAACATTAPPPDVPPPAAPPLRLEPVDRQPRTSPPNVPGLTWANKQAEIDLRFRRQVPGDTPAFVPRSRDGLDLFIADRTLAGWLAFYKGRCGADLHDVCAYRAALYGDDGTAAWDLDLRPFLSADRSREIQDVRLHDGRLYFNEACPTFAAESGGGCSALVRVDPMRQAVDWRTPPLTSNDVFILHDGHVIAGYGFTNEPDTLFVLRQADGAVVERRPLDSAHDYLEVVGDRLYVVTYDSVYTFALVEPR